MLFVAYKEPAYKRVITKPPLPKPEEMKNSQTRYDQLRPQSQARKYRDTM